MLKSILLNLTY